MTIANMKATPINYMGQQMFTTTQVATRLNITPTALHNCKQRKYLKENLHWYSLDEGAVIQLKKDNVDNNALGKITNKVVLWTLEGINKVIAHKNIDIGEDDGTIPTELVAVERNDIETADDKAITIEKVDDIGIEDGMVDGRMLHGFLQVDTEYRHWFPRMVEYGFVEGVDFRSKMTETLQGGRPIINHEMTIEMAKEISMIQRNERGKQARQYFIECEKRLKALPQKPMTQSEIIAAMANQNVEMERRMALTEAKQEQQAKEIQGIRETITIKPDDDWRSNTTKLINKIVEAMGGGANTHMEVRRQIYNALNDRFGVCVDTRLRNKRDRMREVGCSKSQIDKTNILDVIAEDKKLIEGYVAIVKDMAIKYGV
jgi:phage anti-repressor protein